MLLIFQTASKAFVKLRTVAVELVPVFAEPEGPGSWFCGVTSGYPAVQSSLLLLMTAFVLVC